MSRYIVWPTEHNDTKGLVVDNAKSKVIEDWLDIKPGTKLRSVSGDCAWAVGTTARFLDYDQDTGLVAFWNIVSGTTGCSYRYSRGRFRANHWELA